MTLDTCRLSKKPNDDGGSCLIQNHILSGVHPVSGFIKQLITTWVMTMMALCSKALCSKAISYSSSSQLENKILIFRNSCTYYVYKHAPAPNSVCTRTQKIKCILLIPLVLINTLTKDRISNVTYIIFDCN